MGTSHTVLILIDTEFTGGPGKGILQLGSFLKEVQHNPIVVTFDYKFPRSTEFADALLERNIRHLKIKQRFPFDPAALGSLKKIVAENDVNIIQTHGYKGHALALPLARSLSLPWLALTHGWTREKKRLIVYNAFERFLLRFADYCVTVSPQLLEELRKVRKKKSSELIENAIELPDGSKLSDNSVRKKFGIGAHKQIALTIGRLSPEKGHNLLLHAWQEFTKKNADFHLIIVGDGDERIALESIVVELDLSQSVSFAGYQSKTEQYYQAADLFILPSLSEGLPNVLLECLAAKVPFIGTSVGTVPEIIEDGCSGFLIPANDSTAIENALLRFCDLQSEERQMMVNEGYSLLHPRFSVAGRGNKFLRIYDSLMAGQK